MSSRHEVDEARIREHVGRIVQALHDKDLDALGRLYAPDVVSFDVEPPLAHVGIDAKLANWRKVFTVFESVTYEVRDLALTVGGDVAFGHAYGRLSGGLRNGTATHGMWVRITYGLRRI